MKDFSRHFLGFVTVADPAGDVCVDAMEIPLVKLGKAARILLRRFDQQPFVRQIANHAQLVPPGNRLLSATELICREDQKVTGNSSIDGLPTLSFAAIIPRMIRS